MNDPFSVEGKVTIVTGGGGGIGAAIAREFALRGAPVLIASRKREHLEPVRDAIVQSGGRCALAVCDVRDAAACDAMVAEAVACFGRLDVLINNHGASIRSPSLDLSPNAWRTIIDINLNGVFHSSKAAARQFILQGTGGAIINLSSLAGVHGASTNVPYAAAKAGIINLTLTHSAEWGPAGIRVNCIAPGPIDTENAGPRVWPDPEAREAMARSRALGRFGRPEEVAYACLFLASQAASYITGALLAVDGGVAARYR
jgi:NAD(P)-dependent dehydrogenase (short-subunit alcohol dehydrogenase family)